MERSAVRFRDFDEEQQPYRTGFHFQPPKNWMNDPAGPMHYKGVYHLFYQYNPYSSKWGNLTWAHSVSYNLVDWIHLEHALIPTEPYDINGCWTGSVTIIPGDNGGIPAILYTGRDSSNQQLQNLATPKNLSDPFLREWIKSPHNPLLVPSDDIGPELFRDPSEAWRGQDNTWRILIGGKLGDDGAALLYKSDDFISWRRANTPLHTAKNTGMWECLDFFPVSVDGDIGLETSTNGEGVKHVLKAGFFDRFRDYYIVGSYDSQRDDFRVDVDFLDDGVELRIDFGVFYASKSFYDDAKKRRVLWGWVTETDTEADVIDEKGWSGLQIFPRRVWLDKNGKQLVQWPVEEIENLRGSQAVLENQELKSGAVFEIAGITASQADVEVSFRLPNLEDVEPINEHEMQNPELLCRKMNASVTGAFGPFGLLVLASKDLTERTAIFFRIFNFNGKNVVLMCSDQSRSSLEKPVLQPRFENIFGSFLDVDPSEEISLRTLLDHSITESFGGKGKCCITARVYPTLAIGENAHIYAFNNGTKTVVISRLDAWSMNNAQMSQFHNKSDPSGSLDSYDA